MATVFGTFIFKFNIDYIDDMKFLPLYFVYDKIFNKYLIWKGRGLI